MLKLPDFRAFAKTGERETARKAGKREPTPEQDIKQIRDQFKASGEDRARLGVDKEIVLNTQLIEGGATGQLLGWNDNGNRAVSLMEAGEKLTDYTFAPLTEPLVIKVEALANQNKPDATVQPMTQAAKDVAAANQGNRVVTDVMRSAGGADKLRRKMTRAPLITSVVYALTVWNPSAKVAVPTTAINPQTGQEEISGRQVLEAGHVKIIPLPAYKVFLQPGAVMWEDVRWLIIAEVVGRDELIQQFGKKAEKVKPDQAGTTFDFMGSFLPGATYARGGFGGSGELFGSTDARNKGVLKLTYFQLPSTACPADEDEYRDKHDGEAPERDYPNGRYVVIAGNERLYNGPLPYNDNNDVGTFPIARLAYEESSYHPYGRSLVGRLRSTQHRLNEMLTLAMQNVRDQKTIVVIDQMSNVGADVVETMLDNPAKNRRGFAIRRSKNDTQLWFNGTTGRPPEYTRAPDISRDVYELKNDAYQEMQTIAGIQDADLGKAPAGTPGVAIDLLQQSSRAGISGYTGNIEQFEVDLQQNIVACFAQNANGDLKRLMALDDSGSVQEARFEATSFQELTSGGAYKVYCVPGSATPKSPAGQKQEAYDLINAKLTDPTNPGALTGLKALEKADNDPLVVMVRQAQEQLKAEAEQAQARERQHQMELAQQADAMKNVNQAPPVPDNSAEVEAAKQAGETQRVELKAQNDLTTIQAKHAGELEKNAQKHAQTKELADFQAGLQLQTDAVKARFMPPRPTRPTSSRNV